MNIFLSGGTHNEWRNKIIPMFPHTHFFDPKRLSGNTMNVIAKTEMDWLKRTDILFFYFEKDNPSGLGSAFEVGYCIASGVPVLFVDEKRTSHTEWLGLHCTKVEYTLEEGLRSLGEMINKFSHGAGERE